MLFWFCKRNASGIAICFLQMISGIVSNQVSLTISWVSELLNHLNFWRMLPSPRESLIYFTLSFCVYISLLCKTSWSSFNGIFLWRHFFKFELHRSRFPTGSHKPARTQLHRHVITAYIKFNRHNYQHFQIAQRQLKIINKSQCPSGNESCIRELWNGNGKNKTIRRRTLP